MAITLSARRQRSRSGSPFVRICAGVFLVTVSLVAAIIANDVARTPSFAALPKPHSQARSSYPASNFSAQYPDAVVLEDPPAGIDAERSSGVVSRP